MEYKDLIRNLQKGMNGLGEHLDEDGDPGPKTKSAMEKFDFHLELTKPVVTPSNPLTDDFGAPWIFANIDLLGRDERDPQLNARYVPEWKLEGLPSYKTLSGNDYAWCSVRANADRRKVGVKGTNNAGAASWSSWGKKCPFWFGAALDIRHPKGGRHVSDFLYWIDERNRICATLNGNMGNLFCVGRQDLSGSGDVLVTGPRWGYDVPDGQFVSMQTVLAKYPFLKVGGQGSSTR